MNLRPEATSDLENNKPSASTKRGARQSHLTTMIPSQDTVFGCETHACAERAATSITFRKYSKFMNANHQAHKKLRAGPRHSPVAAMPEGVSPLLGQFCSAGKFKQLDCHKDQHNSKPNNVTKKPAHVRKDVRPMIADVHRFAAIANKFAAEATCATSCQQVAGRMLPKALRTSNNASAACNSDVLQRHASRQESRKRERLRMI
jgi:hypothetical protein